MFLNSSTYYFICCLYLFSTINLNAQVDTVTTLPTIELNASRIKMAAFAGRSEDWKNNQIQKQSVSSLSDLLNRESGVFIKSYGLGSIATTAIRGASAGHTAVLWNGFQLQSPMLGLIDLSLIPINATEQLSVQYGGNTAIWGNGAIGGVLSFSNQKPVNKNALLVGSKIGSFGKWDQLIQINIGNDKISSSTKFIHQQSTNNFKYSIRPDLPQRQQNHAKFSQQAIIHNLYYHINSKHKLNFHFWWQQTDREIPPTTTQTISEATQFDQATRASVQWNYINNNYSLSAKTGFFFEQLDYFDPRSSVESLSKFTSNITELEGQWHLKNKQKIHIGINNTITGINSNQYKAPTENRLSVFAAYHKSLGKWATQISLRQTLKANQLIPFVLSVGIEGQLTQSLLLKTKLSRNYRLPTFNDQYWPGGGNPELLAENGWSQELGLHYRRAGFTYSITGFNRLINNWILWGIREGENLFSANNIAKVWSRGIEQRIAWKYQKNKWSTRFSVGYDFIRSTNQIASETPRIEKGSQLFYVPKHRLFGNLSVAWNKWQISYQHNFTDTTLGINDNLKAYQLAHAKLSKQIDLTRFSSHLFFEISNVWNSNYRIIERRPMPSRHFNLGIQFLIKK